jgi:guanylate kinase
VVVSGPSGVGKGTLIRGALAADDDVALATSATTRPRRPGEADGREYWFLTPEEFARRVEAGEFLEHVSFAGHRYGTLRSEVDARLAAGTSVLLEVEVEGARAIKRLMREAVLVFIAPPAAAVLEGRLRERGTNSDQEIATRLAIAARELEAAHEFDKVITNDDASRATGDLVEVIRAARGREARQ